MSYHLISEFVKELTTGELSLARIQWKLYFGEQAKDVMWDKKSLWSFTVVCYWKIKICIENR